MRVSKATKAVFLPTSGPQVLDIVSDSSPSRKTWVPDPHGGTMEC